MIIFDPNIPETESRVQSEPIRRNFNALNDRTNQLTPTPDTIVGSTSVLIGIADKVYFEDNIYVPFGGQRFDLGSLTTGVSTFLAPGAFKQIIVFFKAFETSPNIFEGQLGFIEGVESNIFNHSIDTAATIINNINNQFIPDPTTGAQIPANDGYGNTPLDNSVIICSIIVTNDGQTGVRGAINPILEADIIDIRPFVQRTVNTQALQDHINAPTLAQAHPNSLITNEIIDSTSSVILTPVVASSTITVANGALFSVGAFVRITTPPVSSTSSFVTTQILGILGNVLTLDQLVTASAGDLVIAGEITLDKMVFDIVDELSSVLTRDFTTGATELVAPLTIQNDSSTGAVLNLLGSTAGGIAIRVPNDLTPITNTTWVLPSDEPAVGEVISVESLSSGVATLRWSSPSITTLQLAYNNSPSSAKNIVMNDGYLTLSGPDGVSITATGGLSVTNNVSVGGSIIGNLIGNVTGNVSGTSSNVTGTVAIANGGTGQNTSNDALNALLPTQSSDTVLLSDGANTGFGKITDGYIDNAAAITRSKLATGSPNRLVVNDGSGVMIDAAGIIPSRVLVSDPNGIPIANAALTADRLLRSDSSGLPTALAAITAARAVVSDTSGFPIAATTTAAEIGFVSGVTSAIQTQIDGKADQNLNNLTPTSINQNLVPDSNDARDLGASATEWNDLFIRRIVHNDSTNPDLSIRVTSDGGDVILEGDGTNGGKVSVEGGQRVQVRIVSSTSVTVAADDYVIAVDTVAIAAASTVDLPSSPSLGDVYIIKDSTGGASTDNVTVDSGASNTIDGSQTFVMSTNYQSVTLVCIDATGTIGWSVI